MKKAYLSFAAILIAVILGMSVIIVAKIGSDTAINIKNKGYVTVKGFAKQEIKSDLGIFEVRIISESPDLQACYSKLSDDKGKVQKFLTDEQGVDAGNIEVERAAIDEEYKINERGFATDELIKYLLYQDIKVESADVDKIEKISSDMIDIVSQGVKVSINAPKYIYTDLEDLKIEMIGKATDNARQRAITIAREGKFRLGPIANVRVGVFQITPANSTEVSNYGINDTSSIDKEIKCVVEIRYFVK